MGVDFDPLEEGDALATATLNTKFTDIVAALNDVLPEDIEEGALWEPHLPVLADPTTTFTNDYMAYAGSLTAAEAYTNSLPALASPTAGGTYLPTYQTFDGGDGPGTAPYGPNTVSATHGGGWRIPQPVGAGNKCEVTLGGSSQSLTNMGYAGLLVRFGIELKTVTPTAADSGLYNHGVVIAIGFQDGSSARFVLERSVRWNSSISTFRGDLETSTFLRESDLAVGDGKISKIFGVVASNKRNATASQASAQIDCAPEFQYFNLTVLPIKAGAL